MAYGHSSFCDKNLATYHPKITQDSHKRSTANLWKTSEWAQCPHHPSLEKNGCLSMPQFWCAFFPPNQFSNSWHHKTHLGIFSWVFFRTKKTQVIRFPPTDSFTNFSVESDPGVPDVFIHCRSQLTTTMLSERLRRMRNADDRMSIWVGGGSQISHCPAVYWLMI